MTRNVWYNDNDPRTVSWLRELIHTGHLPQGPVDDRSISSLTPDDCPSTSHFFAGIGGWPYALTLANWPASRPVWTGSCPCQPFSVAGRRRGSSDARHLWPVWLRLIAECLPPTIFGEQVASPSGRAWLAGVRADLEALGYAVGASDLCAASVGAPHIRQRLFFVAERLGDPQPTRPQRQLGIDSSGSIRGVSPRRDGETRGLGDPLRTRLLVSPERNGRPQRGLETWTFRTDVDRPDPRADSRGLGDSSDGTGQQGFTRSTLGIPERSSAKCPWNDLSLIPCRDGKARRVEPGTFPLAHGVPARVGRLRGYGNAIVPQLAAVFIEAYLTR